MKNGRYVPIAKFIKQWHSFLAAVPPFIAQAARSLTTHTELNRYSAQAVNMLKKAGWKPGTPLQKGGLIEPIPTNARLTPRAGIGHNHRASSRAKRTSKSRECYYGYINDDGTVTYGHHDEKTDDFTLCNLSTKGKPIRTEVKRKGSQIERLHKVLWWAGGIIGLADTHFPHPTAWTVRDANCTLENTTVKKLTLAFRLLNRAEPTCKKAWTKLLGPINWQFVSAKYRSNLLTPRDYMTHYKLILHRGLLTRSINGNTPKFLCRLCGNAEEKIRHLSRCCKLKPIWDRFLKLCALDNLTPIQRDRLILLGIPPGTSPLPTALSHLHLITWKFILISFSLVDLKNAKFNIDTVWAGAIRRYISKANSLSHRVQEKQKKAEARMLDSINVDAENKLLSPLGTIDERSIITWRPDFEHYAKDCRDRNG